jgi:DNA-binding transcriptional MerR regulator
MRIGELSRRSGFSIDTLRYYHRMGLVRPSRRNPSSGFREYEPEALDFLALIRTAKIARLSLPQIRKILAAARNGAACDQVVPLLDEKVREIDQAIGSLRDLRGKLVRALKRGVSRGTNPSRTCPILTGLSKGHPSDKASGGRDRFGSR